MLPQILTFDFDLILGSFWAFWGPPPPKKNKHKKILERMTFIYYITMGKIISFSNCLYLETILYPPQKKKKTGQKLCQQSLDLARSWLRLAHLSLACCFLQVARANAAASCYRYSDIRNQYMHYLIIQLLNKLQTCRILFL